MKKGVFFLIIFYCFSLEACTSRYGITGSQAWYRITVGGNIPENSGTSGINTTHLIFIETAKDKPSPEWKTAEVKGRLYNVNAVPVEAPETRLGKNKENTDEIVVKKRQDHDLWQILLTPLPGEMDKPEVNDGEAVVLHGSFNGKEISHKISHEKELAQRFMQ
jgi:hypothetical protein